MRVAWLRADHGRSLNVEPLAAHLPRTRMPPEQRRAQLIEAATGLFATRAVSDVNVEDIVAAAGVSRALFYRYFSGPDEIFDAAARQVADGLIARFRGLPHDRPLLDLLAVAVEDFIGVAEANAPAYTALVLSSSVLGSPHGGALIDDVRAAILDEIDTRLDVADVSPLAWHTLELWLTVVDATVLTWLRGRLLPRTELTRYLVGQLLAMAGATANLDESARRILARVMMSMSQAPTASSSAVSSSSR